MKATILINFAVFIFTWGQASTLCTVAKTGQSGECKAIQNCPDVLLAYQRTREMPTICDMATRFICCPFKIAPVVATTTTTSTTKAPLRVSVRKCKEYGELVYQKVLADGLILGETPVEKKISMCKHLAVPLIVGGEAAREGEFPHMALIGFGEGTSDEDYQCGGSLISELWILSAAHCISAGGRPANFAKVGNVIRGQNTPNSWTYRIIERIPHPNYNSRLAEDDIVLFKLNQPALLNIHVRPICLPDKDRLTTNTTIATGFGRTDYADDVSEVLMRVVIDYFTPDICDAVFEDSSKFANRRGSWDKMICAGSHNKTGDTCNGDSGGPLQIYHPEVHCMYSIIGITSFGSAYCGFPGIPAIYTKVFYYLDWIEAIVWPNQ